MGDLLEFSISNNKQQSGYKISSGALKFYLKGEGSGAIGLASKPNEEYAHKIIIGNQYSWTDHKNKVKTINLISPHTYRLFWISWYGKEIRIGKGDNSKPFLVEEKLIDDINYITFSSHKCRTVYWKFRLPPKTKEPIYKQINDGQLKWVKMVNNCLPEDALIGGYENEVLYIMRAMHEEALTPGKFVPSEGAGYVAWGYDAHKKTDMEVLCGYDCMWIETQNDEIPNGAVEGGYSEVNNEILYAGRATYDGALIPGKVQPSHNVCYMAYEGRTVYSSFYEILVILCGYDGIWVPTEEDRIPPGAFVGGYTEYHETMFVGRALHNNIVIPGKIAPSHKVCYMAYAGKTVSNLLYEILVVPMFIDRVKSRT